MSAEQAVTRIGVRSPDAHAWELLVVQARMPHTSVLWLPALGVAARHYLPFAQSLAARGVTVGIHEWRGHGSSNQRASRRCDWGYQQLLEQDMPASINALHGHSPGLAHAIGGHSLGGQLACCRVALSPCEFDAVWLVASGAPYWRAFPMPLRPALPFAYRFLPWLARVNGSLPGRRLGFGGNEAAGVMRDWAHTALSGRYEGRHWAADIEQALSRIDTALRAVTLADDWLAPSTSLHYLLDKMPLASKHVVRLETTTLGARADHFSWMSAPDRVADALVVR